MSQKKNPAATTASVDASSSKYTTIRPRRSTQIQRIQNFLLVWLDDSIDEIYNQDAINTISKLGEVVNTVNTFTDIDECIDFITDIKNKTFMILSGAFGPNIISLVQEIPYISTIYIFFGDKTVHEQWPDEWTKVQGIFTDISPICEALKKSVQTSEQNDMLISVIAPTAGTTNQNLNELDKSFMYTQILKEILLTIEFEQQHIDEFILYCREQFTGSIKALQDVHKLQREYHDHVPIWWYTYHCFLYSMLNSALRLMEVEPIVKMGFFIRDLHNQIVQLHSEQYAGHTNTFTVYRGQGLSQADFEYLQKNQGGLLSFNNFLSTSTDRQVSFAFADSNSKDNNQVGILFVMKIDPSIKSTPFTNVRDVSYFEGEEEILFSMHAVFRIGQVKQIDGNNRLWQVELTLTSDNDPQLHALTECIREETFPHMKGWNRLGMLLLKLGYSDKAEQISHLLLYQETSEHQKRHLYHMLGMVKVEQGEYAEAITFYEEALEINRKVLSPTHTDMAASYNNLGLVYHQMGEYSNALSFYEKALEIDQKTLPANHPDLATSYNNIGMVYSEMGDYSKALSFYEKALEIRQKALPANHPDLATSYINIGFVYDNTGEYRISLPFYEKALQIQQKALPANHSSLATSYNNIGLVYDNMGEYLKALSFYEKALQIYQKPLPANHPDLATSYGSIGSVYNKMGEYSKALSFHEKSLEIRQKTLGANHPDLATSYNSIGLVYDNIGEYSKALSFHEKALEIRQKTLGANHPDLAISYNNNGLVYLKLADYSKALSFYRKSLEICQKTLPANHPHLATSYDNIGSVYNKMGKHSKALPSHEKALEIRQKALPANHPDLATSYNNIGSVYSEMGDYSKALSFYEKTLDIYQKTLQVNHPNLASSYGNIGLVYNKMEEYSKAFSYYEKALEIRQKTLGANHPDLAYSYNNIAKTSYNMKNYSKALLYLERAHDIQQRSLPPNHPDIENVREGIKIVKDKMQ